ncbi:hypothetical protein Pres01_25100 [Metapseudomonas resinovorans]|nr:hypothetical protein Pres01_25100 [Pseudomonas resinovorans]
MCLCHFYWQAANALENAPESIDPVRDVMGEGADRLGALDRSDGAAALPLANEFAPTGHVAWGAPVGANSFAIEIAPTGFGVAGETLPGRQVPDFSFVQARVRARSALRSSGSRVKRVAWASAVG